MSEQNGLKESSSPSATVSAEKAGEHDTQRGFTVAEKWVIWTVFCLLVGLSSHLLIFPALLRLSWRDDHEKVCAGIMARRWRRPRWRGVRLVGNRSLIQSGIFHS